MIICNLSKIMAEKGLKPYPLAMELNVSRTFIDSLYLNNFERLNMANVDKLCEFLDISLNNLFSYEPIKLKVLYNLKDYIDIKELYHILIKGYFINQKVNFKDYQQKKDEPILLKIPLQLIYKKKKAISFNIICEENVLLSPNPQKIFIIFMNHYEYAATNIFNSLDKNIKQFISDTLGIFFYSLISSMTGNENIDMNIDIKELEGESVPYSEREVNMSIRIDELLSENYKLRKKLGIDEW